MKYLPLSKYTVNELGFKIDSKNIQFLVEISEQEDIMWLTSISNTYKQKIETKQILISQTKVQKTL